MKEKDWVPMEVWMLQICPGCRFASLPLDLPAPCERCEHGSKFQSGEPEPWQLADKKALFELAKKLEKENEQLKKELAGRSNGVANNEFKATKAP